jgi:hypothetical protein
MTGSWILGGGCGVNFFGQSVVLLPLENKAGMPALPADSLVLNADTADRNPADLIFLNGSVLTSNDGDGVAAVAVDNSCGIVVGWCVVGVGGDVTKEDRGLL